MPDIQNLISMANEIKGTYANFSVSEVNDHCLRLAVFTGEYDWHVHPESDELFIILEGELYIDFKDKETAVLRSNDSLLVPKGTVHRTRSYVRTVNLCIEHSHAETLITETEHAD
ncbi:cupin domain-containing protein [Bacillus atrophaeus]|uniref:cupin domain-containing protein n=1 Tax=Bacillus atrophaeus TaxID=1452 RepID=UPI0007C5AAD3|nr:cupin domain-containing protein [Bacillus atrophaeus]MBT2625767.1 cupin domain-containing protein [Bacillus sp. ISL-32]ASS69929.1 cupin domain-containing protein [Bacillus atrophaeus]ATO30193.1 cupin domain-containing protein [Bacillus atrophaeus]MBU5265163.1 cupin domain-containing protein [Bacillus atrophaeus]MCY8488190.1 cupin domain-containing protein [Bacillus atrophaeus]